MARYRDNCPTNDHKPDFSHLTLPIFALNFKVLPGVNVYRTRADITPGFVPRRWRYNRGFVVLFSLLLSGFPAVLPGAPPAQATETDIDNLQSQPEPVDRSAEPRSRLALDLTALDRPIDPEKYLVGPGDELAINIWGGVHRGYKVTISPEATVIVPTVGEISIRGKTLTAAKKSILQQVGAIYPNVPATVTLVQVRSLKVAVTGAVDEPGIYLVTANVRASEVIETAGWQESSSRRRILLFRGDDKLRVDVRLFTNTGNEAYNPYLTEGDLIFVPQMRVRHGIFEIGGLVNKGGAFEFVDGDRLGDAIDLAFGFAVDADTTALELIRFVGQDTVTAKFVIDLSTAAPSQGRDRYLQDDDRVFVRSRLQYRPKASIRIGGEVIRPGRYAVKNGRTMLSEILKRCGGVTDRADLARATLLRAERHQIDLVTDRRMRSIADDLQTDAEREWILAHSLSEAGQVSIDLEKLIHSGNDSYDLPLWDGDMINIPHCLFQINVIGRVRRPGLISYQPGQGLNYYLERAGGLSWRGDRSRIFVVQGTTGTAVENNKIKTLDAGDTIVVPTKKRRTFWPLFRDAMVVLGNAATLYLVIDQAVK